MKKPTFLFLIITLLFSISCQTLLAPTTQRDGTVISACAEIVSDVRTLQAVDIPDALIDTGIKQGDEFDVNTYFDVLPHLSMQEGYALDYVYPVDFLGSFPSLLARPADVPPYTSSEDIPEDQGLADYWKFIEVEDVEQGYFEYVAFLIMAEQFYLVWHANYNDTEIVCDHAALEEIVADVNSGDFGMEFNLEQRTKIRAMTNIEPLVKLDGNTALVEIIVFTKWGGFSRLTYTIDRSFPHEIIDVQEENIVPYDCGVMF